MPWCTHAGQNSLQENALPLCHVCPRAHSQVIGHDDGNLHPLSHLVGLDSFYTNTIHTQARGNTNVELCLLVTSEIIYQRKEH